MTTFERVRQVVMQETGTDAEYITPDRPIVTLCMDSLEMASLIIELENEFNIDIEREDAAKLVTIQDAVDFADAIKP